MLREKHTVVDSIGTLKRIYLIFAIKIIYDNYFAYLLVEINCGILLSNILHMIITLCA